MMSHDVARRGQRQATVLAEQTMCAGIQRGERSRTLGRVGVKVGRRGWQGGLGPQKEPHCWVRARPRQTLEAAEKL